MTDLAHQEPTEPQAKAAFDVEVRIKGHVHAMRVTWIKLAEDLHAFSRSEMWRDLGWKSFEAWLASPEIDIERRQAYYLLEMWRELVVKRDVKPEQLEGLGPSKVQEVLPAIRRGFVDVADALSAVETLPRADLRREFSISANGGPPPPSRESGIGGSLAPRATTESFDAQAEPDFYVCEACGSRVRKAGS